MAHRDAEKSKQLLKQQKLNQSGNYSTFNSNMQQTSTVQPGNSFTSFYSLCYKKKITNH